MKRIAEAVLASFVLLALGISAIAFAQDKPVMPPKVLVASREYNKPCKSGTPQEKTESAFVKAVTDAKWPTHYLAMESLSGKNRALFFTGYESFAAWEKDTLATQKNSTLSSALDHAWAMDGDLLSETDGSVLVLHEEFSLRPETDMAHTRFFEITGIQVKQGHDQDWAELVKIVTAAYEKIPGAHWATYAAVYGFPDTTYIIFNPMQSLAEVDKNFAAGKDFEAAMGPAGMKKLAELSAAAIETSGTNLFAINPRMSYPLDEWVKGDPAFWKAKSPSAPMAKKPMEKPADSH